MGPNIPLGDIEPLIWKEDFWDFRVWDIIPPIFFVGGNFKV